MRKMKHALIAALLVFGTSAPAFAFGCWMPLSGDDEFSISVGEEEFGFRNWECIIASVHHGQQIYHGACGHDDGVITRLSVDENGDSAEVTVGDGPPMPYRRC